MYQKWLIKVMCSVQMCSFCVMPYKQTRLYTEKVHNIVECKPFMWMEHFNIFNQKVENESFAGDKDFLHCFPSGKIPVSSFLPQSHLHHLIVGVLPLVDVDAHRLPVPVRGGDGDGQLSPREQRASVKPHLPTGRHILSSEPERV